MSPFQAANSLQTNFGCNCTAQYEVFKFFINQPCTISVIITKAILNCFGQKFIVSRPIPNFFGDNPHFYDSDKNSKFLVRIIRGCSKFEASFCRNNKGLIKFFHECAKIWC